MDLVCHQPSTGIAPNPIVQAGMVGQAAAEVAREVPAALGVPREATSALPVCTREARQAVVEAKPRPTCSPSSMPPRIPAEII